MRQVEIVDAYDESREPLALFERVCEGADQRGFTHALDAVETDYEGTGMVGGLQLGFVGLDLGEDERDADWGLVVDDSRLEDWDVGGCGHGFGTSSVRLNRGVRWNFDFGKLYKLNNLASMDMLCTKVRNLKTKVVWDL